MRTQEEIVTRINERIPKDFMGFEIDEYLQCLDLEHAKPFLDDDVKNDSWEGKPTNDEDLKAKMLDYAPFAWEKIINRRSISTTRSIYHFIAWIWLLGEDDFAKEIDSDANTYNDYGKKILIKICEHYGWAWKKWSK